jgi:peroxiredoxin
MILWQRTFQREEFRQPAPHFQSRTVNGRPVSLSDFVGQRKLILVFYRGSFSGTSTDRLKELQKYYPKIREDGAELIAISTESENTAARTATGFRLTYPLISDIRITEQYGTYNSSTLLSQPAVFIIDREGIIRWKHIGRGPLDFPPFTEIFSELEKL